MDQKENRLSNRPYLKNNLHTAVLRTLWLLITLGVIILVLAATPLRYQMLVEDVYNLADGLNALDVSLSFFATYFTAWELLLIGVSLLVSSLIAWKRSDEPLAMLVAISMSLLCLLPPLVDGLSYIQPQWVLFIAALRMIEMGCLMAVICLFPNGRFTPSWTRYLLLLYLAFSFIVFLIKPYVLADTAILPNVSSIQDALWLLIGAAWFICAVLGQLIRYRHHATAVEQQQMKWVLVGFAFTILFSLMSALIVINFPATINVSENNARFILILGGLYLLSAMAIPISIAFSILRFRLWDVDIWLNRTLVYGGLTILITTIYLVIISSIGLLAIGQQGQVVGLLLATALILILFKPTQHQLQTRINRLIPLPLHTSAPATDKPTNIIPYQQWLPWAKTAVAIHIILSLILFAIGTVEFFTLLTTPCQNNCFELQLTQPEINSLLTAGLSVELYASYQIALEIVYLIVFSATAGIIYLKLVRQRTPQIWYHLLAAFALVSVATVILPETIVVAANNGPGWLFLYKLLKASGNAAFLTFCLLFPDGRFVPRWIRWPVAGMLLWMLTWVVLPLPQLDVDAEIGLYFSLSMLALIVLVQVYRYRWVSTAVQRQQTKWFVYGFGLMLFTVFCWVLLNVILPFQPGASRLWGSLIFGQSLLAFFSVMVAVCIGISLLHYRLWDIDIILNRTLVYGGLTGFLTITYILLVGGVGNWIGQEGRWLGTLLTIGLAIIVARPLKQRLQTAVDQLIPPQASPPSKPTQRIASAPVQPFGIKLLRIIWVVNLMLAIVLFVAGLAIQIDTRYLQNPATLNTTTDIALNRVLTHYISATESSSTLFMLVIASYMQAIVFVGIGVFLFWRKRNDVMGLLASWLLIAVGIGFTPTVVNLPLFESGWHVPTTIFQIGLFGSVFVFLCLFPNGCFYPTWIKYAVVLWFLFMLLWFPFPQLNPHRASTVWPPLLFAIVVSVGILSQLFRYRRMSDTTEKQKAKWVIAGFLLANVGLFGIVTLTRFGLTASNNVTLIAFVVLGLASMFIPITISVALIRYRLWQIDIIINRTLVYGGITAVILLIYALFVGGFSLLWQSQNNLILSLLATGLIAVLFQPVRERLQRAANRLMFGERDDPYAVLSHLTDQLQTTNTPEAMLQSVVQTIAHSLKLPYVAIRLADEQGSLGGASTGTAVATTVEIPLRYQNETVGHLVVSLRSPSESFTDRERKLLADMAGQTGAMAYSVRLTAALQRSREKLVLAREEERRRIRRDLHDELGPTLASQTFTLDTAVDLLQSDPNAAIQLLQSLKAQNQDTVAHIRQLVHQLRPPALDELGLKSALEAYIAQLNGRSSLHIHLNTQPDPLPPLSAAVEVAAYRITLEALNNVIRHAQAKICQVSLVVKQNGRSYLHLHISDNGTGLPANVPIGVGLGSMRERTEELGGQFQLFSNGNKGTQITAVLPITPPKEGDLRP